MTRQDSDLDRQSNEKLLDQDELSNMLGIPKGTLEQWRSRGRGPGFFRIGRYVRYDPIEVREWLRSRRNLPRGA